MDINKYKFYVRDIGISDEDLANVLQDVINDIALSTRIFKKAFGFTIEPDIYYYNFRALLGISERVQEGTINDIVINSFSEEQLIQYLSNPTNLEVDIRRDVEVGIPLNTYLETLDVLVRQYDADNAPLGSVFYLFEPIDGDSYKFVGSINKPIESICITTIIPNVLNIDERLETYLRPAIIEGLKYYTDTSLNLQNVNPNVNSYKKFVNAKIELQNKFPVYIGKQIKRSPL